MTEATLQQVARALYYGSIPALSIDASGRVADYNVAMETVFGDELNGRRYSPFGELLQSLNSRVIEGTLVASSGDCHARAECSFDSPNLGQVRLAASMLPCHHPSTEQKHGDIIFWNILAGNDVFHERYRRKLDRQLIWDTYAWSYDRILPLMPYYQEVLARHVAALTEPGGPVIDLGAGTGNLAEQLVAAGHPVTAVEPSRAMLERLRSKEVLASALGTQLTVLEASAEFLPMIEDQSFTGVSLQLSLFDMRRPELGLSNAARVLRSGGHIVVTDIKRGFQLEPILQECESRLHSLGRYDELAADLQRVIRSNHDLAPGSRSKFRIEDVFDSLAARGFANLSMQDSHFGQCATVSALKP
jgi:ubiquinone/menaquinone biosynthesis C-methylase UbiE